MVTQAGSGARALFRDTEGLIRRAEDLLAQPERLRAVAREQTYALTRRQVQADLGARPVSVLHGVIGGPGRLDAVRDAGYRTLADLARASADELTAISGIGPRTAERMHTAARTVAEQVAQAARFRFQPDSPDSEQRDLLATLTAIRRADGAVATVSPLLRDFGAATRSLLVTASPAAHRVSMLLAGRAKKRAVFEALGQLDAISIDPRTTTFADRLARLEAALRRDAYTEESLWRSYSNDAASINALLSTLGGVETDLDQEAAEGFVPDELRQRITAVPLDTSLLRATLRGYQVFGAQYAIHQQRCILGDEMGLGKTVQALAVLAHLAANGQQRFLVVCPASVQINWLKEIDRHSRLAAHSLHGPTRQSVTRRWLRDGGVAVTTFNTLGRLGSASEVETAMLVVDEAQYVKNPNAARSRIVLGAAARAQRVLFLTGTPMENRVQEFRTLVGYLQPQVARRVSVGDVIVGANQFRRTVASAYLRRNQEDVLTELPERIEVEDWVELTPGDVTAYRAAVQSRNLMRMRQAAFASRSSAKLERILEITDEAREDGRKVIVFSYFLGVLGLIQQFVGPAAAGPIRGSVPPIERQRLIDDFTGAPGHAVLLSQIDAGGVGLNVQAASVVILAEPQWKPSTEEQAIARAHRMGQIRTVQVHRVLAKDSVDERMREVQEDKRLLFDEYARRSEAKESDRRAVDPSEHRPDALDDAEIPVGRRIVLAEEHRLGLARPSWQPSV